MITKVILTPTMIPCPRGHLQVLCNNPPSSGSAWLQRRVRAVEPMITITSRDHIFYAACTSDHLPIPTDEADAVSRINTRVRKRADLSLDHHGAVVSCAVGGQAPRL